ncbi:MAG: glycosyltransferase, partial [Verrucomicrobiaceae bacterium]|nr:glycosyltransferase [Verrucomicrobiaceae bacterium]
EMLSPEGGSGLEVVLRENAHKLSGILNGADYARWDPATDPLLPQTYNQYDLSGKRTCRDLLLDSLGLAPMPNAPVFGMVTRLVPEKGFDVLIPILDRLLSDDVRLIILGEGDAAYERALAIAAKKYRTKFAYRESYDETLAHLIEAGADITLIPSGIEPSGLSAMFSLKYGALPVARATGGIQEIIEDYDPTSDPPQAGYGFLYYDASAEAFWDGIKRAKEMFHANPHGWITLMRRAMAQNFSWATAAARYEELYSTLTLRAAAQGRDAALRRPRLVAVHQSFALAEGVATRAGRRSAPSLPLLDRRARRSQRHRACDGADCGQLQSRRAGRIFIITSTSFC